MFPVCMIVILTLSCFFFSGRVVLPLAQTCRFVSQQPSKCRDPDAAHLFSCLHIVQYLITKSSYQVSWFAVGCYYLMVGHKNEHARRYLRYVQLFTHSKGLTSCLSPHWYICLLCISCSKATTLERTYGPAWIAYGHSFAVESEHDQAMAAYFTAAQLMKGLVHLLTYFFQQW